jgi:hypothetical protein
MSDPVEALADGVEGAVEGAVESARIQGTRRAESCVGLVENRLHG